MEVHVCNPCTQEVEAGGLLVQGQPELSTKTISESERLGPAIQVAQQALATKPDNLNIIPSTHMMEGKTQLCRLSSDIYKHAIPWVPTCIHTYYMYVHINVIIFF